MSTRNRLQGIVAVMTGLLAIAVAPAAWGDDVHLKDGSLIKGQVIEEAPGGSYTVRRADGSEHTFPADQVKWVQRDAAVPSAEPKAEAKSEADAKSEAELESVEFRTPQGRQPAPRVKTAPTAEPAPRLETTSRAEPVPLADRDPSPSKFRSGISFGFGVGAMVPTKKEAYMDLGADAYPEFRVASDLGPVEIGLSVGVVYRSLDAYYYSSDYGSDHYGYTLAYVPVEFHVNLLPVRFGAPRCPVQPYLGVGLGGYVGAGDNQDSYALVSPAGGIEFFLGNHNILGLDFSYHHVFGGSDTSEGYAKDGDLDYFTAVLCYRFRIPFGRH